MDEEKRDSQRRVSFAPEPQINYIYHDESNSTKNSSSMNDAPMDLTTDIPEFKSLNLFKNMSEDFLNKNVEDLFQANYVEEYKEDPILLKEFARRRQSLSRKDSLDPLRKAAVDKEIGGLSNMRMAPESLENGSSNKENTPVAQEELAAQQQTMRKSLETSFNDTAIGNSSYEVEELVSTVDLKNFLPVEKKEPQNIDDFLRSIGIRFLDDTIADGMRRDTLSKSRNDVNPALYYHYKYSLKERIDYLYNFSGFLCDKMKELHSAIEEAQKGITVEGLNRDLLKKIRNESRNRSKIDWYNLRRLNEIQFNKNISANRTKLVDLLNSKKNDEASLDEQIGLKMQTVADLREKADIVKKRLMQNRSEDVQEVEKLQKRISDGRDLLNRVKEDYKAAEQKAAVLDLQQKAIESGIAQLRDDCERLRRNLLVKSIGEPTLNEAKAITQRYCNIYRLKIIKITTTSMILSMHSCLITLGLGKDCCVTSCSISAHGCDPCFELVVGSSQLSGLPVYLTDLAGKFILAHTLQNEIERLREQSQIEVFFVNQQLHVRMMLRDSRKVINFTISRNFELMHKNVVILDLRTSCKLHDTLIKTSMCS